MAAKWSTTTWTKRPCRDCLTEPAMVGSDVCAGCYDRAELELKLLREEIAAKEARSA